MTTETTNAFAQIQVTLPIDEQRVRDLLCGAWKGGSTYWCGSLGRDVPPEAKVLIDAELAKRGEKRLYGHEYAFFPGVKVNLTDAIGEIDSIPEHPLPWVLTREKLIAGLQVMATKYPRHFADFQAENDDADTSDVYFQCCLFGEIVFG